MHHTKGYKMLKLMLLIFLTQLAYAKAPTPVPYASMQAFSGLWYEIARTENRYQKSCVASSVEYVLTKPQKYTVYNRCFDTKIGGKLIEYKGSAKPKKDTSISTMQMTYFWIFTKEYRIIYLQEDYSSAVVTDEAMEQVWIMSRTPTIRQKHLEHILTLLEPYMNLERLIYTPQDKSGRYK